MKRRDFLKAAGLLAVAPGAVAGPSKGTRPSDFADIVEDWHSRIAAKEAMIFEQFRLYSGGNRSCGTNWATVEVARETGP